MDAVGWIGAVGGTVAGLYTLIQIGDRLWRSRKSEPAADLPPCRYQTPTVAFNSEDRETLHRIATHQQMAMQDREATQRSIDQLVKVVEKIALVQEKDLELAKMRHSMVMAEVGKREAA